MYHTHLALCTSCVCLNRNLFEYTRNLFEYNDVASTIFPTQVCTSPRYASITAVSMSVLCLFSLTFDASPLRFLLCVHAVSVFQNIWWQCVNNFPILVRESIWSRFCFNSLFSFPILVRESIWSRFSFNLLLGDRFSQLPNRSWVAPSPFLSPWLLWVLVLEARDCLEC